MMRKIFPDFCSLEFYRGWNCIDSASPGEALMYFEKTLEKPPVQEDFPCMHPCRGTCLRDFERREDAIGALEKVFGEDEGRPDINNVFGVCHLQQGGHEQAAWHFQCSLEFNPDSAIDYANLEIKLQRQGHRDEALRNDKSALEIASSVEFAARGMMELLEQE